MLIRRPSDIQPSEITPRDQYLQRRQFMAGASALGLCTAIATMCGRTAQAAPLQAGKSPLSTTEEPLTPLKDITSYNNYYEFGTDKEDPVRNAHTLTIKPWKIKIDGLVAKPADHELDDLIKPSELEERIYRMRCVEGWSMVVPWQGFQLSALINRLEPTPQAKYIEFQTLYDPGQLPEQRRAILQWPYVEGLRMDEAMNPLAILAVGLYGKPALPNQNGAPIRLVTPWKYGFKGIKSIAKIRFVEKQPVTAWMKAAPNEYGFFANVNPAVDHPRWSQATERRIGEFFKRKTLPFNGYADQVASMYAGMDLKKNF
jgi:methionine sulfoxide reductase catalytic subunit